MVFFYHIEKSKSNLSGSNFNFAGLEKVIDKQVDISYELLRLTQKE